MRIGSLFSGIGGLELGLERAGLGHTVWQCERDQAAQRVLRRHWPNAIIHDDVRNLDAAEPVDVLCGGFPCQDLSVAGRGAGLDGARSGLWFEYLRVIRALRPRLVVVENVAAIVTRGLDVVLGGLAASGYDALWLTLRASDVGAPHRRERLFIIATRLDVGDAVRCEGSGVSIPRRPGADALVAASRSVAHTTGVRPADWHRAQPSDVGAGRVANGNGAGLALRTGVAGDDGAQRATAQRGGVHAVADGDGDGRESLGGCGLLDGEREALGHHADGRGGAAAAVEHEWPPGPRDRDGWAMYLTRYPHRAPAITGRTGRPQLSPAFVETLMGFPEGWTDGESRPDRLRMLGNAVVPQVAEAVGLIAGGLL